MRLHLTDGTLGIEIDTPPGRGAPSLRDIEDTARRLIDHMRAPHPDSTHPADDTHPFGFTHRTAADDDTALDGIALGSDTERAEPYIEPGRDLDDEYDDRRRP
ncbi:hypothetical protein ACFVIY_37960 [Streptomyces sp. NPDC127166]|uniref:hypothetical protein n=1 Tax=Streptomyces sp. NPDC127166 TaxID=3345380 RepID=UPI003640831C